MAKYQFKKQSGDPSDKNIRSKMDLNKILQQQQHLNHYKLATKPLYKKPLFLGFIILLVIICLLLVLEEQPSENTPVKPLPVPARIDSLKK